jgi:nucleotide-binding universal stress UspA family protein
MSATRILVGYDGRPSSRDALALAVVLAEATDARLVVGVVVPEVSALSSHRVREEAAAQGSAAAFAQASAQLEALDVDLAIERRAIAAEPAAEGLADLARSEDAGLVVIGATHRGPIGRIVPGTTVDQLLADPPCAVAVAPRGYAEHEAPDLRLVGLAYDGSDEAKRATRVAQALARRASAPLRAFGVRAPLVAELDAEGAVWLDDEEVAKLLERELDQLLATLPPSIGGQKVILAGDPVEALLAQGPDVADLVVFGSHGFGRVMRIVGASVTSEVARAAPWPVIVVPPHGPLAFAMGSGNDEVAAGSLAAGAGSGASKIRPD